MFKTLAEIRDRLNLVEKELKEQSGKATGLAWNMGFLQRELDDYKTWNSKLKAKNSALRKDRRRLRQLLETHGISWEPQETFHERA